LDASCNNNPGIKVIRNIVIIICSFVFSAGLVYGDQKVVIMAVKSTNIPSAPINAALSGFRNCLKSKDIQANIIEYDYKDNDLELLESIKSNKPDLVLALGTDVTKAIQDKVKNIPIVFTMVLNPKRSGISVSGVSMDIPYKIILQNLKTILPDRIKVGVVYSAQSNLLYEQLLEASQELEFEVIGEKINSDKDFPKAIASLSGRIDYFLMLPDPKIYFPKSVEYLLREGLKEKFPVIGLSSAYTRAGALVSFDCDYTDLGEQTAGLALEILAEKKPIKTRLIFPRKTRFSLNLLVAQRIGIEFPSEIVKQASEVFGK
jgi:putative ABC transport system substrate-binding protein